MDSYDLVKRHGGSVGLKLTPPHLKHHEHLPGTQMTFKKWQLL